MSRLDITAVTERFKELTGLSEAECKRYEAAIKQAAAYFERLMLRDPVGDEAGLCEYSCACKAFFDYTVFCSASALGYSTPVGDVAAKISGDGSVAAAERLMRNSMSALPPGLIRDDGFIFESTEG